MRGGTVWRLGWWAPLPPALEPDDVVDPTVHGALLSAVADGAPLDRVGQHRLDALKAAGLATADGRPRFPVARAAQAKAVADAAGDLGRAVARLLAGEWSRLEVEYEPVHATVAGGGGQAAFLVVGGLVLDLGVRRLLRRQGLAAPPFGSAFLWLAEGERAAGTWFARVTGLPGRGNLVRFGRPDTPAWELAAVDPEAAAARTKGRSSHGPTPWPWTRRWSGSPTGAWSPHPRPAWSPSGSPTPPWRVCSHLATRPPCGQLVRLQAHRWQDHLHGG